MNNHFRGYLLLGVALALPGCGKGKLGEVAGTVTLNGKPLSGAKVIFQPDHNGRPSTGVTDENGRYVLRYTTQEEGAEVGTHTVQVVAGVIKKDRSGEEVTVGDRLPREYNIESQLKEEVKPGSQEINFDLKADKKIYYFR